MLLLAILIEVRVLNTAQIVGGPGMYDNIIHTYHDYQQQMATLASQRLFNILDLCALIGRVIV